MAKRIYLIRHGKPQLIGNQKCCIGRRSDPPLAGEGIWQAEQLRKWLDATGVIVHSPLLRAIETARIIGKAGCVFREEKDVTEIDVGVWEGLSFSKIRRQYPKLYAERGEDWSIPMPGGETMSAAADRMEKAVLRIMEQDSSEDATIIVTHSGAIRALLWKWMKLDPRSDDRIELPYGSVTVIEMADSHREVTAVGRLAEEAPSIEEIEALWEQYETPKAVRQHARAVAEECWALCERLGAAGVEMSQRPLYAAALLHDLVRTQGRGHEQAAAEVLLRRGYLAVAHIIGLHGDGSDGPLDEAQILYYADKRLSGSEWVSIEERFARSLARCKTDDARKMHALRLARARSIEQKIKQLCR